MSTKETKEFEGMLNSSLEMMFRSMIRKQVAKQSVDPRHHRSWVDWLASSDRTHLLDMINANAIKHCWGTGAFIVVDDQPQNESTKCQVIASDGIDDIEKNLGEKPPFCDPLRKACPLKLIDRFPIVVVYGVPKNKLTRCSTTKASREWVTRCSIMMMPFVASHEPGTAQAEWVPYFENHEYADELPKFTVDELRSSLAKSMQAAYALRHPPSHQNDTKVVSDSKAPDSKAPDSQVQDRQVQNTKEKVTEMMSWEGADVVELKVGTTLHRGSPVREELALNGTSDDGAVSSWFSQDAAVATTEAGSDKPPDSEHGFTATYDVQRPLKLVTLTPGVFAQLKKTYSCGGGGGVNSNRQPTLEVALRIAKLLPTSSQISELIGMVVDRVPSVDPSLWQSVDAIFRAKLAEVLATEQFHCQPPITFRDVQNEFAEVGRLTDLHSLTSCFTIHHPSEAGGAPILCRRMLPPIERQVTRWLSKLAAAGQFPFDGLLIPAMSEDMDDDDDNGTTPFPSQLALTAQCRSTALKLSNIQPFIPTHK